MAVRTYNPNLQVVLHKNVAVTNGQAQRAAGANRTIDLTPYFGDGSSIQIAKSLYRPDGTWSLTWGDQVDPKTQDTIYALIQPMDQIEIRGSRTPYLYAGAKLPLLMRGFVSKVARNEEVTDSPRRIVTVSGHDFGKLWLIHGLWMEVAVLQNAPLLTSYQLQAALGMSAEVQPVSTLMQAMTTQVINVKIQAMYAFTAPTNVPQFTCSATVTQGVVAPQALGLFQAGPFWNIVKKFSDSPWNELWITDSDDDGPTLIFRPTPYKDLSGNWIGGASDPGTIPLDSVDVVAISTERSDEQVANFFWVPPGASEIFTPNLVQAADILAGTPFDFNYPNNSPNLFGYRMMNWETNLLPNDLDGFPLNQPPAQQNASGSQVVGWHQARGNLLKQMNQDNLLFENVNITARGSEFYTVGKYVALTRGNVTSQFYLTGLSHSIEPLGNWTTTLAGERGTGFVVRNRMQQSPYWAEGRPGSAGAGST